MTPQWSPSTFLTLKTGHKHAMRRWYEELCVTFRPGDLVLRISLDIHCFCSNLFVLSAPWVSFKLYRLKKKKGPAWIKSWDTAPKKCMFFFSVPSFWSHNNGSSKYLVSALCICETYCLARLARKFSRRQPLEGLKLCQHRRNWCSAKRRRDSRIK